MLVEKISHIKTTKSTLWTWKQTSSGSTLTFLTKPATFSFPLHLWTKFMLFLPSFIFCCEKIRWKANSKSQNIQKTHSVLFSFGHKISPLSWRNKQFQEAIFAVLIAWGICSLRSPNFSLEVSFFSNLGFLNTIIPLSEHSFPSTLFDFFPPFSFFWGNNNIFRLLLFGQSLVQNKTSEIFQNCC